MNKRRILYFLVTLNLLAGVLLGPTLAARAFPAWRALQTAIRHEESILRASNAQTRDFFGAAVAISGNTLIAGATSSESGGYENGVAYVFEHDPNNPNNWNEVATLHASDIQENHDDGFGLAVAFSGNTLVIGAPFADTNGNEAGATYIFERDQNDSNNWNEIAILHASDAQPSDVFGYTVAISGDTLIVGAKYEDGGAGDPLDNSGAAYVFERDTNNPNNWNEAAILHASDAQKDDYFSSAIAISGNTLIVGASGKDNATGSSITNAGAAYVFERDTNNPNNWNEVAILHASDAQEYDFFGQEVAISGNTLVVGAKYEDGGADNPLNKSGAAYVFERDPNNPNNWNEAAILHASDAQEEGYFGHAIAISGNTLIVGAVSQTPSNKTGVAYVFERDPNNPNNWNEVTILHASDAQAGDKFGYVVSIDGDMVVVGAPHEDGGAGDPLVNAGAVYIFGPPSDPGLSKAVTPLSAAPGESIAYTLAFSNTGEHPAYGVVISDTIPTGLTVTDVSNSGATITATGSAPAYTWEVANLGVGDSGTITITAELGRCLLAGQVITNTATISGRNDISPANNSGSAAVTVLNSTPVAIDDAYTTPEDIPLQVEAANGILANDEDANCDPLQAQLITTPASGNLNLAPDGSFTYTPDLDFTGVVSFTYTASDGIASPISATASITVTPNILPVAVDDDFVVISNTVNTLDVLSNDSDPDGGSLSISAIGTPDQGGTIVNGSTLLTYTPAFDFIGIETFTYTISDGQGGSATATVTIDVVKEMIYPVYLPLIRKTASH